MSKAGIALMIGAAALGGYVLLMRKKASAAPLTNVAASPPTPVQSFSANSGGGVSAPGGSSLPGAPGNPFGLNLTGNTSDVNDASNYNLGNYAAQLKLKNPGWSAFQ